MTVKLPDRTLILSHASMTSRWMLTRIGTPSCSTAKGSSQSSSPNRSESNDRSTSLRRHGTFWTTARIPGRRSMRWSAVKPWFGSVLSCLEEGSLKAIWWTTFTCHSPSPSRESLPSLGEVATSGSFQTGPESWSASAQGLLWCRIHGGGLFFQCEENFSGPSPQEACCEMQRSEIQTTTTRATTSRCRWWWLQDQSGTSLGSSFLSHWNRDYDGSCLFHWSHGSSQAKGLRRRSLPELSPNAKWVWEGLEEPELEKGSRLWWDWLRTMAGKGTSCR